MIDQGSNHIIRKMFFELQTLLLCKRNIASSQVIPLSVILKVLKVHQYQWLYFYDADQVISRKGITGGESIDLTIGVVGFDDEFKIESKKHNLVLNSVKDVTTAKNRQLATLEFVIHRVYY